MKLIVVIICAVIFQAAASVSLGQTVTLHEKNAPLATVLKDIKKQTGYSFFYDESVLEDAHSVTINVKDKPLKEVLDACFQNQPLEFSINANTIGIKKKEVQVVRNDKQSEEVLPAPPVTITGKVTDSVGTPLIGATINVKGTKNTVTTDDKGEFQIKANLGDVLLISFIGYKPQEIPLNSVTANVIVVLKPSISGLKEVVVSNGYQKISAERATGSYDQIDNKLLNRSTGVNILDRLQGISSGAQASPFVAGTASTDIISASPSTGTGIMVRGVATLSSNVGSSPLVVLDNFPYLGNINNINPNDIESISILKDAAAASIWGAQAGNGVLVITTKQGKLHQKMQIDFNANATILSKPNYLENPNFLNANEYINVETYLFGKGYYNSTLSNTYTYPAYSPVVGILAQQQAGAISATQAASEIDAYRNLNYRTQLGEYFYQTGVNQQYSLGISGGGNDLSYRLGMGWDDNKSTAVGNSLNRKTLDATTTYFPVKGLEITTNIKYTQYQNNVVTPPTMPGPVYEMLADANGNPLPITYPGGYSTPYINSLNKEGYLDWNYYPINELHNTSNVYTNKELLLNLAAIYKITNFFNIEARYQNESQNGSQDQLQNQQSYFVTNLINKYSRRDPTTGAITYNYPLGDLYTQRSANYDVNNYRLQANLNKTIGDHQITGLAGAEIRRVSTEAYSNQFFGYDPQFGTFNNNLNFTTSYPGTPVVTSGRLPHVLASVESNQLRYISYFSNLGYSFKDLYTFSLTGRKDGSNIFGVNTNDRFNLLWSAAGAWNINNESFYHLVWLPQLKLRLSYGFNGNVYNGTGYTVGSYSESDSNLPAILNLTAPNPNLSWERVRNLNLGFDFTLKNNILYGSIDIYRKDGLNLIEPVTIASVTGFSSYTGNAANTKGKGLDLNLNSDILKGKFKWTANLLANFNTSIITKYDVPLSSSSLRSYPSGVVGKPVNAIFSYKWAGLDPTNGNPRGYLNGQISENYNNIINNYKPDSLIYNGSAVPTAFGSLRNSFSYKKVTLSVMISYEAGFYFRKPSSTGNYTDLITQGYGADFAKAWQKPGDEQTTNVPSYIYPSNSQRATFYQYSQILVQNGANIRLNDARIDYDLSDLVKRSCFSRLSIFSYAHIAKLLWTANKDHLDPDAFGAWVPNPFTISFGLQATLK